MSPTIQEEPSVGELFSDLSNGISRLIQQEVALAKIEMSQTVDKAKQGGTYLAAGGALLYAGLLVLLGALVLILSNFMAPWLAALVVGLAVCLVGFVLVRQGASKMQDMNPAPKHTLRTLKENTEWMKRQIG